MGHYWPWLLKDFTGTMDVGKGKMNNKVPPAKVLIPVMVFHLIFTVCIFAVLLSSPVQHALNLAEIYQFAGVRGLLWIMAAFQLLALVLAGMVLLDKLGKFPFNKGRGD